MGQNLVVMRDLKKVKIVETLRHKRSPFVTENVPASAPTTCAAPFANALEKPSPIEIKKLLIPLIHLSELSAIVACTTRGPGTAFEGVWPGLRSGD
jgi:hypothetical protein